MIDAPHPDPMMPSPDSAVPGGWLDLQKTLCELLYEGKAARCPLPRLAGIERQALDLLQRDPDESLFTLFQALTDLSLGYCATHALLSAVVCALTADQLGRPETEQHSLFRSALVMNIGMAEAQDTLAQQSSAPNETQRKLIQEHPRKSLEILQHMGVTDGDQLDIVRWHHELDESSGLPRNWTSRHLLHMADGFVAKLAARKTRLAMSPLSAAKSLSLGAAADSAQFGLAMATAVGFYPPGTYVQLMNGEKAVSVARGLHVNTPPVVSIVNAGGMPLSSYIYRDTREPKFAIRSPINAEKIKVRVNLDQALKARKEHAT